MTPGIASILVGTDGSQTAGAAVDRAVEIALGVGARLLVVGAYAPVPGTPQGSPPGEAELWVKNPSREDVLGLLARVQETARDAGVDDVATFARVGDAADAILDVAEEQRCDVIVVGDKGLTGATRFLLGSVPAKISQHAPCSVLIVRTA